MIDGMSSFFMALILGGSSVLLAQEPSWKGQVVKEGDVTVVHNPKVPIYGDPILTLKEDLVVDGGKAQGEAAFSQARSIDVDAEGNIYVADLLQACVRVFNKAGVYLRTIGRRGQGPGELSFVNSIVISKDNREVRVCDTGNLIVFDLQGRYKRKIESRGLSAPSFLDGRGNVFVSISDIRERRTVYRVFSPDLTTVLADIAIIPDPPDRNMYSPQVYWILDPQDRLVFGHPKTYELDFYDEHYKIVKKIRRDFDPARMTDEDKEMYLKRSNPPGVSGPPKRPCPSVHAAFRSFFSDDHGRLMVQTWERSPDGKHDIHDIYDAQGRFLGRLALNVHPDPVTPTATILKNNKLYTVEVDKEGYDVVKRYAVTWEH